MVDPFKWRNVIMQGGKKMVVAGILLLAIVVAVVYGVRKSDIGGPKEPEWYRDRPVEKIDKESLQLMTKPWSEWEKLGHKERKYKNPETGKYTMVPTITDPATGQKGPVPDSLLGPPSPETTPENLGND